MVLQLFIRGNDLIPIEIESTKTIGDLKREAGKRINLQDLTQLNLYYNGTPLSEEERLLDDYLIAQQSTIDLDIGLLGGKVHGSLARAGKVKGQTPKVAKQEGKKKRKTGRAKRRLQYNRRFVNVVAGPGKRRGPNSNAA